MNALLVALLLSQAADAGIDAPTAPAVYKVGSGARITLGYGDPIFLPEGYFLPEASFNAVEAEIRRLQWIAANPPEPEQIEIPFQGFLIAAGVGLVVGLVTGAAVGYLARPK